MKKVINIIMFILFFITGVNPCLAEQTIKVAFGNAMPPWVIPDTNEGITLDILKKTLEPAGIKIEPVYYPYARRIIAYASKDTDAVCDINQRIIEESKLEGHMTVLAYAFENIGISLKKNAFNISKISDLEGRSVVAWQGAKAMLGGEYAKMADNNKLYREVPNQLTQVNLLYTGREDVIQLDRQIFRYFKKQAEKEGRVDTSQPIDEFPIFGKNENGFLFRDKKIQELFDQNFIKLKESGDYDKIFKKYTE